MHLIERGAFDLESLKRLSDSLGLHGARAAPPASRKLVEFGLDDRQLRTRHLLRAGVGVSLVGHFEHPDRPRVIGLPVERDPHLAAFAAPAAR